MEDSSRCLWWVIEVEAAETHYDPFAAKQNSKVEYSVQRSQTHTPRQSLGGNYGNGYLVTAQCYFYFCYFECFFFFLVLNHSVFNDRIRPRLIWIQSVVTVKIPYLSQMVCLVKIEPESFSHKPSMRCQLSHNHLVLIAYFIVIVEN